MSSFKELPKADCHSHLLLSAPWSVYQALPGPPLPACPETFEGLPGFLDHINRLIIPRLSTIGAVTAVIRAALHQMITDRVTYCETSIPLTLPSRLGLRWHKFAEVIQQEIEAVAEQLSVSLEMGHARDLGDQWKMHFDEALSTGIFSGVDLYGNETIAPAREFLPFFCRARENGLRIKLHLAEVPRSPEELFTELNEGNPDAIQHGGYLATAPKALDVVIERRIPLHLAPCGNVKLGLSPSYKEHPIRKLFDSGAIVTLATDDYALFGTSLSEEFERFWRAQIFSSDELATIRLSGLKRGQI